MNLRFGLFLLATMICLVTSGYSAKFVQNCDMAENERVALRNLVKEMFRFGFDSYIKAAYPRDNLMPLSCNGTDSMGGLLVTLVDNLDTLLIFEEYSLFKQYTLELESLFNVDINRTVNIFETTIRVIGGLLSSHVLLTEASDVVGLAQDFFPEYSGSLLKIARKLADRFLPAFETPTGIPFGSIHLINGVSTSESLIACTAGAGTLLLEFGTLSRLTGDPKYYHVAYRAMKSLFAHASSRGLLGKHIHILNGKWLYNVTGIGGDADSFFEYLLKGFALFGDYELLKMFQSCHESIRNYLWNEPWYFDCDIEKGTVVSSVQSSLSAFFPSLEVLCGNIQTASRSHRAFCSIFSKFGMLPEAFSIKKRTPVKGSNGYPLRPELFESNFYLFWATGDPSLLSITRNAIWSLENLTRTPCGYSSIRDVNKHDRDDIMESFFLSETCKYLLFSVTPDHWIYSGRFILSTEAHPFLVPPAFGDENDGKIVDLLKVPKCRRKSELKVVEKCGFETKDID
ncbi:mannosyl-oligosaccharide alpha-1,2-mannosidase [Galdieria sulphuraria]|uniref:alpha-1,2-Mannosidase n=1 Tax=Galdieria sulphuraria TaxID=130081 RepID=M2XBE2_GALSU|nr:mannosyl-oligosaccharide alpha-1,2-mannosidase [Galdieria sulphuraria]EME27222.1 mannosyl-oligosaccharide alpha-1,2-mannosidase [Galdieria sulphuraria]|eukprot:XP_005703742.1 mannosyl-oligosaccharide alpha-1,2-mannosidase [Galdieria sulphuraria]